MGSEKKKMRETVLCGWHQYIIILSVQLSAHCHHRVFCFCFCFFFSSLFICQSPAIVFLSVYCSFHTQNSSLLFFVCCCFLVFGFFPVFNVGSSDDSAGVQNTARHVGCLPSLGLHVANRRVVEELHTLNCHSPSVCVCEREVGHFINSL